MTTPLLAVELDGVRALGESACSPRHWESLVTRADRAGFVLAFLPGSFVEPGSLDAAAIAARVAPVTSGIGLVPSISTTHTEPFHVSKAVATLDHLSGGRAGWTVVTAGSSTEYALFGRRPAQPRARVEAEACEFVDVVVRLWDSWDDDAVIRDSSTGRYLDRDRLRHIDFTGGFFAVKGPSITPRPPQGHAVVVASSALSTSDVARRCDVVRVAPESFDAITDVCAGVRANAPDAKVFVDVEVRSLEEARHVVTHVGALGVVDGISLCPTNPSAANDLMASDVAAHQRGSGPTLRERLGLPRPANGFSVAGVEEANRA